MLSDNAFPAKLSWEGIFQVLPKQSLRYLNGNKMEITTSTVYTRERLLKFSRFHFFSNTKRIVFYSVLTVLLFISATVSLVHGIINKSFNSYSYYFILLFVLTVLLDIFNLFTALILPLFTVKKAKSLNATVEFTFKDDGFTMKSHSELANGDNFYAYSAFERAANKKDELLFKKQLLHS